MLGSILITALGILAMNFSPSYGVFLVVVAFFGVPHGITYTASLVVVSRTSTDEERSTAISRLSAYTNLPPVLVPVAIGYLIGAVGWDHHSSSS